jgi:hypothetical protein
MPEAWHQFIHLALISMVHIFIDVPILLQHWPQISKGVLPRHYLSIKANLLLLLMCNSTKIAPHVLGLTSTKSKTFRFQGLSPSIRVAGVFTLARQAYHNPLPLPRLGTGYVGNIGGVQYMRGQLKKLFAYVVHIPNGYTSDVVSYRQARVAHQRWPSSLLPAGRPSCWWTNADP